MTDHCGRCFEDWCAGCRCPSDVLAVTGDDLLALLDAALRDDDIPHQPETWHALHFPDNDGARQANLYTATEYAAALVYPNQLAVATLAADLTHCTPTQVRHLFLMLAAFHHPKLNLKVSHDFFWASNHPLVAA